MRDDPPTGGTKTFEHNQLTQQWTVLCAQIPQGNVLGPIEILGRSDVDLTSRVETLDKESLAIKSLDKKSLNIKSLSIK